MVPSPNTLGCISVIRWASIGREETASSKAPNPTEEEQAPNQSAADKIKIMADFDFKNSGMYWVGPDAANAPASIFPGQTYSFYMRYENKGLGITEPNSKVIVEIKKSGAPWEVLEEINIPLSIPCHSGVIESQVYTFALPDESHPYITMDKKRAIRLRFENGNGVPEIKTGNNKSKSKKIKIVPVPTVSVGLARGVFEPKGRAWGEPPGTAGNSVLVTATLTSGGPDRRIMFVLDLITAEPGICMNYGGPADSDYYDLDMKFVKQAAPLPVNDAFDTPVVVGLDSMEIISTNKESAIAVEVTSFDYGGYARIQAMAVDENDQPIGVPSDSLSLPADENNGNSIADSWSGDETPDHLAGFGTNSDMGWDDEKWPGWDDTPPVAPEGSTGDGITRFEEYRGFMRIADSSTSPPSIGHVQLSPEVRELFVHRESQSDLSFGGLDQLLTVIDITADQMNGAQYDSEWDPATSQPIDYKGSVVEDVGPRVVNFNYPLPPLGSPGHERDQHGLWLSITTEAAVTPPPAWIGGPVIPGHYEGIVQSKDNTLTSPLNPGRMGRVHVYRDVIDSNMGPVSGTDFAWDATQVALGEVDSVRDREMERIIMHELAHGISVEHHNDYFDPVIGGTGEVSLVNYPLDFSGNGTIGTTPQSFPLYDSYGSRYCVMRWNVFARFAAIAGDTDNSGPLSVGDGVPLQPGEDVDDDWFPTVPIPLGFCDGTEVAPSSFVLWPPGVAWTPDQCLNQIIIDDGGP